MSPRPGRSWPLAPCRLSPAGPGPQTALSALQKVGTARGCLSRPPYPPPRPPGSTLLNAFLLTTASFGLPGYRAAAPLSSGTWGNCWSASFAGATASGSGLVLQRSMRGPVSSSHLLGGWAHACSADSQTLLRKSFHFHALGLCECRDMLCLLEERRQNKTSEIQAGDCLPGM